MTDNNHDIDKFFREVELRAEPELHHYRADWLAMQGLLTNKPMPSSKSGWNPGMPNGFVSIIFGGCLVAGLIFIFNKKKMDPEAANNIAPVYRQDETGGFSKDDSTSFTNTSTDTTKTLTRQVNDQSIKSHPRDTVIANKSVSGDLTANTNDSLLQHESGGKALPKPGKSPGVHSKKPGPKPVYEPDSSYESKHATSVYLQTDSNALSKPAKISEFVEPGLRVLEDKKPARQPVNYSFDTLVIQYKNGTHVPSKKSRSTQKTDTVIRKQKKNPD